MNHLIKSHMHQYMASIKQTQQLAVQPRMGFSPVQQMHAGLQQVKQLDAPVIGTITLDAMTRQGNFDAAQQALKNNQPLNGYPIVSHPRQDTQQMLQSLSSPAFPIQVRHGSPLPLAIFKRMAEVGIDATEGGPVSYCLPYGRIPLRQSMRAWAESVEFWAQTGEQHHTMMHLESFAGCMMGQLCPPSLLMALSILEGLFFYTHGIRSLSLSFAQGTNQDQDIGGLRALQRLIDKYLPQTHCHMVMYTWMGVFPKTPLGAKQLIETSAATAVNGGASRLIVKTLSEAYGIPTIQQNLDALQWCHQVATHTQRIVADVAIQWEHDLYDEANTLIEAVLNLDSQIDLALLKAFTKGYLDIPFCLHPDNAQQTRAYVDPNSGVIAWQHTGKLPLTKVVNTESVKLTSTALLHALSFYQHQLDVPTQVMEN